MSIETKRIPGKWVVTGLLIAGLLGTALTTWLAVLVRGPRPASTQRGATDAGETLH